LHRPVLVLNSSFEPINVCAARRALVLVLKGVAATEEHASTQVHSARQAMKVPSVIRLLEYRRIPLQARSLSRKNILMRDRYTCQYCMKVFTSNELTLDHVMPRSRKVKPRGKTWWPAATLATIAKEAARRRKRAFVWPARRVRLVCIPAAT
jgi:5-methylcytosine-specific restriction endonuclease McrA